MSRVHSFSGELQIAGIPLFYQGIVTGDGLVVTLTGGDREHLGAVAWTQPRPSLRGEGASADVSLLVRPGHRDDELARQLGKELAMNLEEPLLLAVGIHVDQITQGQITALLDATPTLARVIRSAYLDQVIKKQP